MKIADWFRQAADIVSLLPQGGPSCCNIAVTNVCNARCDFCGYALDKQLIGQRVWMRYEDLCNALDVLYDRGIRYLTFTGGEPMLHPRLADMVWYGVQKRMRPAVVTNGSRLVSDQIDALAEAGLRTIFISIDSASRKAHEANRGLRGVCERIRAANARLEALGVQSVASVTISHIMGSFDELIPFLRQLGFSTVTFTYPKRWLGSSSLVYSETSPLVDFADGELAKRLEELLAVKQRFAVLNPEGSIREMIRFLRGEPQRFPCYGGYKYFLLDWNGKVYRCDFWRRPMGSIDDFRNLAFIRDDCTKCMSVCYRDSSVLFHAAVSFGDALRLVRRGRFERAAAALLKRTNLEACRGLVREWGTLRRLARVERQRTATLRDRRSLAQGRASDAPRSA